MSISSRSLIISLTLITGLVGMSVVVNQYLNESLPAKKRPKKSFKPSLKGKVRDSPKEQPAKITTPVEKDKTLPPIQDTRHQAHEIKVDLIRTSEPTAAPIQTSQEIVPQVLSTKEVFKGTPQRLPQASSPENVFIGDEFPLKMGSQGARVERLQIWLMRNYGLMSKVNGQFDEETQKQVQKRLHTDTLDESTFKKYRMDKPVHEQVIIR